MNVSSVLEKENRQTHSHMGSWRFNSLKGVLPWHLHTSALRNFEVESLIGTTYFSRGFVSARLPGNAFLFFFDCTSFETSWSRQHDFRKQKEVFSTFAWRIWKTRCRKTFLKDEIQWKILFWFIYELNSFKLHSSNTLNDNWQDDASTVQRVTSLLDINSKENVSRSAIHFGFKLLTTSEPSRDGACFDD